MSDAALATSRTKTLATSIGRADEHPVAVYLASLPSANSKRAMRAALVRVARLLSAGKLEDPMLVAWQDLRYQHAQAVRAGLLDVGFAPSTVNQALAAMRRVLRECFRLGLLSAEDYHRAADVRSQSLPAGRDVSKREQAALFRAYASGRTSGVRNATLLGLAFGAGLRRAEIAGLDLSDYTQASGRLIVTGGKGRKDRVVFAANGAKGALDAWLALRGNDTGPLLCPVSKSGKVSVRRMSSQAVYAALRRIQREAGVSNFSPHDARRTWVADLLHAGADLATVQALAGHASTTTTSRYVRRGEGVLEDAARMHTVPYSA